LAFYQAANHIAATLALALKNQFAPFDAAGSIEHARGFSTMSAPDRIQYFQPVFRRYCRPELLGLARKIVQRIFLSAFWDKMSPMREWGAHSTSGHTGIKSKYFPMFI